MRLCPDTPSHRSTITSAMSLAVADGRLPRPSATAGGRALVVGGWVRDRLLRRAVEGPRPRGVRHRRRIGCAALLAPLRPRRARRPELPGLQGRRASADGDDRRGAAAPRVEARARPQGLRGATAIRPCRSTEAARRRDFTINAIAWDPLTDVYEDPFDGRADLDAPRAARRRSRDVRRRQPARAARRAVRGALRVRARRRHGGAVPPHPARRPAGRARLGRDREAAARRPRGRRSASRWRSTSASSTSVLPELRPLVGCEQEPEWHPEGDVWMHTLMVIDQARELNGDLDRPRLHHRDARRRLPRPRQAGDDGVHRRPHPLARPRAGRRRADPQRCSIG